MNLAIAMSPNGDTAKTVVLGSGDEKRVLQSINEGDFETIAIIFPDESKTRDAQFEKIERLLQIDLPDGTLRSLQRDAGRYRIVISQGQETIRVNLEKDGKTTLAKSCDKGGTSCEKPIDEALPDTIPYAVQSLATFFSD